MSLFRNLLIANQSTEELSPNSYVRKGLVFQLDGIEKGDTPNVWIDLINGVKFTCRNCIFNNDNVQFNGTNSDCYNEIPSDQNKLVLPADTSTIEAAFEKEGQTTEILYLPSSTSIAFGYVDGGFLIFSGSNYLAKQPVYDMYNAKMKNTVSVNCQRAIQNTINLNVRGNDYWNGLNGATYLGCRGGSKNYFKGKIHSIRIYNRQLTEEEMIHNQDIDNKRFFGGTLW